MVEYHDPHNYIGECMKVKDQIEVLKSTIQALEQLNPEADILGHVAYPDGGYSGDVDGEVYNIEVEDFSEEEDGSQFILGVHYK